MHRPGTLRDDRGEYPRFYLSCFVSSLPGATGIEARKNVDTIFGLKATERQLQT